MGLPSSYEQSLRMIANQADSQHADKSDGLVSRNSQLLTQLFEKTGLIFIIKVKANFKTAQAESSEIFKNRQL